MKTANTNASDKQVVDRYRAMTPEQRKQFRATDWKRNVQDPQTVEQELQAIDQGA